MAMGVFLTVRILSFRLISFIGYFPRRSWSYGFPHALLLEVWRRLFFNSIGIPYNPTGIRTASYESNAPAKWIPVFATRTFLSFIVRLF